MPTLRRQVYELTLHDLDASPVWEFAMDEEGAAGQDEATVRPLAYFGALDPSIGMLIIEARFWLADGRTFRGYLTPPSNRDPSLGAIQPQIITGDGQVGFWCGVLPPDKARVYAILGGDSVSVFPIRFQSEVEFVGGPVSGEILGLYCLEDDFQTVRIEK